MTKNNLLISGLIFVIILSSLSLYLTFDKFDSLSPLMYQKDFYSIIDIGDISFADEEVLLTGDNFFNKEKLDKEISITRFNIYQFILYHKREPLYFPIIEKALKENSIPNDFKYLTVAESGLRNDALSSANAGGIWQFVPGTAKEMGLIVNKYIDERYNFEKSTKAAIGYLAKLYKKFNNRSLVAAAYNRGATGIQNALNHQNTSSYYLPRSSIECSQLEIKLSNNSGVLRKKRL